MAEAREPRILVTMRDLQMVIMLYCSGHQKPTEFPARDLKVGDILECPVCGDQWVMSAEEIASVNQRLGEYWRGLQK